jgi:pterin-4a-carbinolamine dehydratase
VRVCDDDWMDGDGAQERPRYRPLSSAEVRDALPSLPGWTGDSQRLRCTVVVPDPDALLAEVAAVEAELDHHAAVERDGPAVTLTVWTHSRQAVTDADVELARRISAIVTRLRD